MADPSLTVAFLLLVPFAWIGLGLVNAGLTRSRSAAHSALSTLLALVVAVLAFLIFGSALAGVPGQASYIFQIGSHVFHWAGAGQLFSRSFHADDQQAMVSLVFELFACCLAVQFPVASGAERWRLTATCLSTVLLAGVLVPLVEFWIWGGGFLSQLGTRFGLGTGALDVGGAGVIHVTGGLAALTIAWQLGARQGKFTADGIPTAMPGHNAVIVLVGSLLALVGWIGMVGAGVLIFFQGSVGAVLVSIVNLMAAAAGAALAAFLTTRTRFGKPDASLTANGWVCGLVAISAGAPFLKMPEALLIGLGAGVLVVFAIELLELHLQVDDPAGTISVHAVGGIWGLLLTGLLTGHFLVQLITVGTLIGFVMPATLIFNLVIQRLVPQRVDAAGERQGMDLFELGAGAYPEFVVHREDSLRR